MVRWQNFNNNITRYALQLVRDFEIYKHVLIQLLKMLLFRSRLFLEKKKKKS